MKDNDNFASAYAHLTAALPLLDGLGLHLAAADVCQAIERMDKSEQGATRRLNKLWPPK